ncbi:olfactory receptor 52K2-like [Puma concolor]|uniref:Olfactory receptor 52K2-like n=1 Tax=Puma concolor TaxID=9696 RepID=A0A6P6I911_PUMCO|nr:olfactory receptor 52K2-like [Puma concolor]
MVTSASNITSTHPSVFVLMGIPGLQHLHNWISIPFCSAYTLALLGNCTLLFIIQTDAALHEPMYLFLAMLAVIDLVLSSTTLPKMLAIFWFRDQEINFYACLVQMFFIFILRAVLQLASQEARYKAFGTCVSHIGAILAFYTPVVISSVMHRVARQAAPHVHILFANFYLLFPPMINPIIYGVKTKQIRKRVLGLFSRKDV